MHRDNRRVEFYEWKVVEYTDKPVDVDHVEGVLLLDS